MRLEFICGLKFTTKGNLMRHKRSVHLGKKALICNYRRKPELMKYARNKKCF